MAVASLASSAFTRIGDEIGPEATKLKDCCSSNPNQTLTDGPKFPSVVHMGRPDLDCFPSINAFPGRTWRTDMNDLEGGFSDRHNTLITACSMSSNNVNCIAFVFKWIDF